MTDLAHLPPLPPIGLSPISQASSTSQASSISQASSTSQAGPELFPSGHGDDRVTGMTGMTGFDDLPPLHPAALSRTHQASPTLLPSRHAEDLAAGTTVLMAGLVALAWALRLDPTDGQVLVAACTSFTLLAPLATCTLMRSARRRAPHLP
ncbi:MAG: hypothetical protein ABI903_05285 [Actinomycetota bacterium]